MMSNMESVLGPSGVARGGAPGPLAAWQAVPPSMLSGKALAFTTKADPGAPTKTAAEQRALNVRRGKWTAEEQLYAEQLIADFTAGTVGRCDEGITLRAFLARELRCDRMRISKKFAGASIGKLIFRRQGPATVEGESQVKELREAFQRSACASSGTSTFLELGAALIVYCDDTRDLT